MTSRSTPREPLTVTVELALFRHPPVGRNRLYQALRTGALQSVPVGKRTAILITDLDAWVLSGCPTDRPSPSRSGLLS